MRATRIDAWTPAEDAMLAEHKIPEKRTYQAARRRARAIGVKLCVGHCSRWTDEEIAIALSGRKPKGRTISATRGARKRFKGLLKGGENADTKNNLN